MTFEESEALIGNYLYQNNEWALYVYTLRNSNKIYITELGEPKHIIANLLSTEDYLSFDVINGNDFYSNEESNIAITDNNFNIFYCREGYESVLQKTIQEYKEFVKKLK